HIIPQFLEDGRTIPSRGEDWRGAIAALQVLHQDEPLMILVSPGLVEEDHVVDGEILSHQENYRRLGEYFRFPLDSCYSCGGSTDEIGSTIIWPEKTSFARVHRGDYWFKAWLMERGLGAGTRRASFDSEPATFGTVRLGKTTLFSFDRPTSPPAPQSPPSA